MKLFRKLIIGVMVIALLSFTVVFILNAYNTGKIGDKAGKIADTFTEDIVGSWTGKYSISKMTFNPDGTTSLTMLGIVLNGEYSDSYDLQKEVHTLTVTYKTSLGLTVERVFTAELKDDTLSLIDSQLDSVKMIYNRENASSENNHSSDKTEIYNPGIEVYRKELSGEWQSDKISNSGYNFKDESTVHLKIYGVGYDGRYSVSIDPASNRCLLKINYVSIAGVTVSNTYFVTIEDNILTLTQKGYENISTSYYKVK